MQSKIQIGLIMSVSPLFAQTSNFNSVAVCNAQDFGAFDGMVLHDPATVGFDDRFELLLGLLLRCCGICHDIESDVGENRSHTSIVIDLDAIDTSTVPHDFQRFRFVQSFFSSVTRQPSTVSCVPPLPQHWLSCQGILVWKELSASLCLDEDA